MALKGLHDEFGLESALIEGRQNQFNVSPLETWFRCPRYLSSNNLEPRH